MLHSFWSVALSATLGAGPAQYMPPAQGYYAGPQGVYTIPQADESYYAAGGESDQLHPYDSPEPWLHGYIQEIPAYGGYGAFRPYNYKHVPSQSQAAAGWGMPPMMPYSQQFWHRYADEAAMQQHLTEIGSAEYAAELARLRARHDFEAQRSGAVPAQGVQLQSYTTTQPISPQGPTAPVVVPPTAVPNLQPVQPAVNQQPIASQAMPQPQYQPQPVYATQPQAPPAQTAMQASAGSQSMGYSQPGSQSAQNANQFEAMRRQIELQQAKLRALESNIQKERQEQQQQAVPKRQKRRSSGIKPIFER